MYAIKENKIVDELPIYVYFSDNRKNRFLSEFHVHEYMELIFVLKNNIVINVDGKELTVGENDLALITDNAIHRAETQRGADTQLFIVQFMPRLIFSGGYASIDSHHIFSFLHGLTESKIIIRNLDEDGSQFASVLQQMVSEYTNHLPGRELLIKSHIYYLIGMLVRKNMVSMAYLEEPDSFHHIQKAVQHIEANYQSNITLESVADIVGFSKCYFSTCFKKVTGSTFTEYINFVRINEFEKLLVKNNMNICEAAYEVGFRNISNFNRTYKRIRRISPQMYKAVLGANPLMNPVMGLAENGFINDS